MTDLEKINLTIEIVKAFAAVLMPIVIAIFGFFIHKYKKDFDSKFDLQRDIFARRFMHYEEISSLCNDIYCFHALVGHYKSITPEMVIEKKRQLEALVFSTLPLWNDDFCMAVNDFLIACYETQRGRNTNAISLADIERHREERDEWNPEWEKYFLKKETRETFLETNRGLKKSESYRNTILKPAYSTLLSKLSDCVGGHLSAKTARTMM